MNALFDLRTIFLVGACTSTLAAMTCLGLAPMYRPAAVALHRYALALAGMAIGLTLFALRDTALPDWTSYVGANWFVSAGVVLTADATRRLFGRSQPGWLLGAQMIGLAGLWTWLGSDPDDVPSRVLATAAVQSCAVGACLHAIRRSDAWGREAYVRSLAAFFAGYALIHLSRGIAVLLGVGSVAGGVFAPSPAQTAFGLLFALSPIALALIVQMMLHARISGALHRRATTDELTGLHSRRHFFDLSRERLRARRASDTVHHLLMIDLDHFKSINDRFGHPVGDRALRHAARVLKKATPDSGLLGRYGGEEFCALIGSSSVADANRTIDALRRALESAPLRTGSSTIMLTASIGAVPIRNPESLETVLVHADHCVYRAKTEGRNRVVCFGEMLAEPVV
ncbi:MAG: GGDEF domain-containing protein [Burkholderiaceae bacterium]|nr:GGDEF domain-containing protein [Burkholderiaceae bacterium]